MSSLSEPAPYSQSWQRVLREGFFPLMPTAAIEVLHAALVVDAPELIQGQTCRPLAYEGAPHAAPVGFCPVSLMNWRHLSLKTVSDVEDAFAAACFLAEEKLGEPASSRFFFNWWDNTPRSEAVPALLAEVRLTLAERQEIHVKAVLDSKRRTRILDSAMLPPGLR